MQLAKFGLVISGDVKPPSSKRDFGFAPGILLDTTRHSIHAFFNSRWLAFITNTELLRCGCIPRDPQQKAGPASYGALLMAEPSLAAIPRRRAVPARRSFSADQRRGWCAKPLIAGARIYRSRPMFSPVRQKSPAKTGLFFRQSENKVPDQADVAIRHCFRNGARARSVRPWAWLG